MTPVSIFSLILLLITIGAQHCSRSKAFEHTRAIEYTRFSPFSVALRWLTLIGVAGLIALLSYQTTFQYFTWLGGGSLSRLLLPPYQPISYFAFYALTEFWANSLLAAAIGTLGYLTVKYYARQDKPFFYPEEPLLCFIALTLVGHPLWLLYVAGLLLCALVGSFAARAVIKTNNRISFRYLWLPLAALILTLSPFLNQLHFVIYLRF